MANMNGKRNGMIANTVIFQASILSVSPSNTLNKDPTITQMLKKRICLASSGLMSLVIPVLHIAPIQDLTVDNRFIRLLRVPYFPYLGLSSHFYLPSAPEDGSFSMIEQGSYYTARTHNDRQRKEQEFEGIKTQ